MEDKFVDYYPIIDAFDLEKMNDFSSDEKWDSDDPGFFRFFSPFNMAMLMKYLEFIIYKICDNKKGKEKVLKEIKSLYEGKNNYKDYKWKDISLSDLMKGEYFFLKEKFIIKEDLAPDISYFINNYCYPTTGYAYPFSLKELYYKLLERGIMITINNYYYEKSKEKIIEVRQ